MKPTRFILKEKINDMDMSVIIIQQHYKLHTHTYMYVCTYVEWRVKPENKSATCQGVLI
jgi:hypothetical protein